MSDTPKCKGFWNMCGCPRCCAVDRELEEDLASGKKTFEQATDEFEKERQTKRKNQP